MGTGIDLLRSTNPEHAKVIDDLKDQLLIVFMKRLGGDLKIPVAEVDDTAQDMMSMSINDGVFHFVVHKKQ